MRYIVKTSKTGLALIKEFEGCSLKAYWDATGRLWTIGYGHTSGVCADDTITQEQADNLLEQDVSNAEKYVNAYMDEYNFNQNQFDALVSFTFNCGCGNLHKLTDNGKRSLDVIAQKILLYTKSGGVELKGLVRRRKAERELFVTPVSETARGYYPRYTGTSRSIDEILIAIGAWSEMPAQPRWKVRQPIALANGMENYTGKAHQNNRLVSLAKSGKLIKP